MNHSSNAEDQLFNYEYGWKLCIMDKSSFQKHRIEAVEIRDKYQLGKYLQNPTKSHKAILEANRNEIERAFDILSIGSRNHGFMESCESLKKAGFFGLEHKEE